jgi:hypothetical protein
MTNITGARSTSNNKPTVRVLTVNVSSALADTLFNVSNVVLAVGALLVFAGTVGTIAMGLAKEHFAEVRLAENETETKRAVADSDLAKEGAAKAGVEVAKANEAIAKANERANSLEAEAAKSRERAAQLEKGVAEANARAAEAQLALEQFKAPRWITDAQHSSFVSNLGRFQGTSVDIWLIHAPSQDAASLASRLLAVLGAAHWNANGVFNLMGGVSGAGVFVVMRDSPTAADNAAATALVNELNAAGLAASLQKGVTDKPVETLGAFVGPNASTSPSNLWVIVGSKP